VLGAGGITGGAFHAGVLAALADAVGWDARTADVVVGTSAGSLTGTLLRRGIAPADLLAGATDAAMSRDAAAIVAPLEAARDEFPFVPGPRRFAMSAPTALLQAARRPWAVRPGVVAAALLPPGAVSTDALRVGLAPLFGDRWPTDALWICAVRLRDGRRVVFGRPGSAPVLVADAVAASCAIPSFFVPVTIEGERYVDGGAHSPTNADVLRREPLDLVIVSSPMSYAGRRPRVRADFVARQWARTALDREARALRRGGATVIAFQPTSADREVMGFNPMDPERRTTTAAQVFESTRARLRRAEARRRLAALLES